MSIVWIGEPSSKNASLVGKKAANLSVLKYTHQIPAGFIIPATAIFNEEFTVLKESIITEYKKLSSYTSQECLTYQKPYWLPSQIY